jgi:pilus assembly protein CpaE
MNLLAPLGPLASLPLSHKKHQAEEQLVDNAVVGILGSKGGTGATTLAINLAADLSKYLKHQLPVCLIDANLQQPDAALYLNCSPEHTLTELLSRSDNLEPQTVEACKISVDAGQNLRLISPPVDGSAATRHDKDELSACLPHIAKSSSVTVVDLPRRLDKTLVMLLDQCSVVVVVVEPNVASIAATRRWLDAFSDLEYSRKKIVLAANRLGSKAKLLETQLSSSFHDYSLVKIPNAFKAIEASQIEGIAYTCANPRDPYSKAINSLSLEVLSRMRMKNDHLSEGE